MKLQIKLDQKIKYQKTKTPIRAMEIDHQNENKVKVKELKAKRGEDLGRLVEATRV